MSFNNGWPRYIPVAKRRAQAEKKLKAMRKGGKAIHPVIITGRKIAHTFWGKAWCDHLVKFSDYENRLSRGRSYVRNGSVCHLEIAQGKVSAMVSGSSLYQVTIDFKPLSKKGWSDIQQSCSGKVGSLLELLQGRLSDNVMQTVTHQETGLFPQPREIKMHCSCPDGAYVCKHIAAVMYGVGARLDESPESLFLLRGVDHQTLVADDLEIPHPAGNKPKVTGNLADIFGIQLESDPVRPVSNMKKTRAKQVDVKKMSVSDPDARNREEESKQSESCINTSRGIRASHILTLRKEFSMTPAEFSRLIGESFQSLKEWESSKGVLSLEPGSRMRLEKAFAMNRAQAWESIQVGK